MLFWITEQRSLSQSWVSPLSVPHLLDFSHVKILPTKVVGGKAFQNLFSTDLLRYVCLVVVSAVNDIICKINDS